MKNTILIVIVALFGLSSYAQKDIIYPTGGDAMIFDCKINGVNYGNVVNYTKNDSTMVVKAISIVKDGVTIGLIPFDSYNPAPVVTEQLYNGGQYKGHSYGYYEAKYNKAKGGQGAGIVMTVIGLGSLVAGAALVTNNKSSDDGGGTMLYGFGFLLFNIGVPVAISNGVKKRNNYAAMQECKNNGSKGNDISLNFGVTTNGVGALLKF